MANLTKREKSAIATLKRLEKRWPPGLWVFAADSKLYVMAKNQGEHQMLKNTGGSVDPDYVVATIYLEADGGDW